MGWVFLAIIVLVVVFAIKANRDRAKIRAAEDATFMESRQGWDLYISPYERQVIGLNPDGSEIVLGLVASPKTYSITDVASVEVLRDGASVTSTNRGAQMGGALVGGLLLGEAGLLLGGLSGPTRTRATIQSLALKIIVDDRASPIFKVEFFRSPDKNGIDAKHRSVEPFIRKMDHQHALLVNAIRKANQATAAPKAQLGSADELSRLWELKQAGALSDD